MKEFWDARKSQIVSLTVNIGSGFFIVYCLVGVVGYFMTFLAGFLFVFVLFVCLLLLLLLFCSCFFFVCFLRSQRNPCMKIPKAKNFEQIITLHKWRVSCEETSTDHCSLFVCYKKKISFFQTFFVTAQVFQSLYKRT